MSSPLICLDGRPAGRVPVPVATIQNVAENNKLDQPIVMAVMTMALIRHIVRAVITVSAQRASLE